MAATANAVGIMVSVCSRLSYQNPSPVHGRWIGEKVSRLGKSALQVVSSIFTPFLNREALCANEFAPTFLVYILTCIRCRYEFIHSHASG